MTGTDQTSAVRDHDRGRIEITLRIWHAHEDPDAISKALQLAPTYSYKAGDQRMTPKGRPLPSVHRETLWCHDIEVVTNATLTQALDAMDTLLASREQQLKHLRMQGFKVECFVGLFLDGDRTEVLTSEQMSRSTRHSIDLVLGIYAPPAEAASRGRSEDDGQAARNGL